MSEPPAPRVTVLMPVYNAAAYLREAMDSVLTQTFADFEFLIVNDGSTDDGPEIIRACPDPRVRLVDNAANLKLAATLNRGLARARGEYIARMDADDISLPQRLARQVAFLDAHSEIGLCGTWAQAFGEADYLIRHAADPELNRCRLLFDTVLAHPTVMLRRGLVGPGRLCYATLPHFEDYALWQRAAEVTAISNIPEVLLRYRVTVGSAFHGADRHRQTETYAAIDAEALARLGLRPTAADLSRHLRLRWAGGDHDPAVEAWLRTLRDANRRSGHYDRATFEEALRDRWELFSFAANGPGSTRWLRYIRSPISRGGRVSVPGQARRMLRFLLRKRP